MLAFPLHYMLKGVLNMATVSAGYKFIEDVETSGDKVLGINPDTIEVMEEIAKQLGLHVTVERMGLMRHRMEGKQIMGSVAHAELRAVLEVLVSETVSTKFLHLNPIEAQWYEQSPREYFGETACDSFPDSLYDFGEAIKCLSLGRATASVFHTMRALENVLKALWVATGSTEGLPSHWGGYLAGIKRYVDSKPTPKPADWDERSAFFLQAHNYLFAVKDGWRNNTMHSIATTYRTREAQGILENARTFIGHVAKHVGEGGIYA
jgi:hypothetical protein